MQLTRRLLVMSRIRDTQCGFKVFRRDLARAVFDRTRINSFAFDIEVLFLARKLGARIVEMPVATTYRDESTFNVRKHLPHLPARHRPDPPQRRWQVAGSRRLRLTPTMPLRLEPDRRRRDVLARPSSTACSTSRAPPTRLGADFIDTTEHVLMGLTRSTSGQGWEPHHLEQPQPEALSTLAAMAGATARIRLLSVDRHRAAAPGRAAGQDRSPRCTRISRGRFVMGVTASWQKDEYDALGVPFEQRGQVLDDNIGACRALWAGAPASFHSPTSTSTACSARRGRRRASAFRCGSAASSPRARSAASSTLGDGWMPFGGLRMTRRGKSRRHCTLRRLCRSWA